MITQKMNENAHKVAFLVQTYPDHKLPQIIALLGMPAIDINAAVWAAVELGFVSEPDQETGEIKLLKTPQDWSFGDAVETLKQTVVYSFEQLAKRETDLEENYLSNWTAGYPSENVIIALKSLVNDNVLAEYAIEDGDSTYNFFTLAENKDKLWGRKQFKKDPLQERKQAKTAENTTTSTTTTEENTTDEKN